MPDTVGSLTRAAALAACALLIPAARAAAQQPTVAPAPSNPEFFSRYDFHLNAARLITSQPETATAAAPIVDQRFSWDTHFGGSFDLVDYVEGRAAVILDYEAVLGSEFRAFDPNQGNYTLEGSLSKRIGDRTEIAGFFHHVSRHLSDRAKPKSLPVAWNELGARVLQRASLGAATVDIDLEGGRAVEHAYVDYTWMGEAHLLIRRPLNDVVGLFAHGSAQIFAVDTPVAGRETQTGGVVDAGVRLNGRAGAIELFVGYEKRVDADPLDRLPRHWGLAGFRLLSR
jgi:hypothetical protein